MKHHPYKTGRPVTIRIHTTPDSLRINERHDVPCTWVEGGRTCGLPERRTIHHPPYPQKYETKEVDTPAVTGIGDDAPLL